MPKVEVYGDSLFLALRTAELQGGEVAFGETHIFVREDYLITVRHGASRSYSVVREHTEACPKLLSHGVDYVLHALLDFVVDNYQPVIDELQAEVDAIEERLMARHGLDGSDITRIYDLRRQLVRLRRVAAPMAEVCSRLRHLEVPFLDKEVRPYFKDVLDHVQRVNESIDGLREVLSFAFEAALLLQASRQGDVSRKIAAWAAILAVPTAIAGIYGMNFEFMPELTWRYGYFLTLGRHRRRGGPAVRPVPALGLDLVGRDEARRALRGRRNGGEGPRRRARTGAPCSSAVMKRRSCSITGGGQAILVAMSGPIRSRPRSTASGPLKRLQPALPPIRSGARKLRVEATSGSGGEAGDRLCPPARPLQAGRQRARRRLPAGAGGAGECQQEALSVHGGDPHWSAGRGSKRLTAPSGLTSSKARRLLDQDRPLDPVQGVDHVPLQGRIRAAQAADPDRPDRDAVGARGERCDEAVAGDRTADMVARAGTRWSPATRPRPRRRAASRPASGCRPARRRSWAGHRGCWAATGPATRQRAATRQMRKVGTWSRW